MSKIGFDNALYVKKQAENIKSRIKQFDNKLYLEFGGKLFDDYHAARVLPGFDPSVKVKLLTEFKDDAEIIFCINAGDIEKKKIRADFGITYDLDLLRVIDNLRSMGLLVSSVVITRYSDQPAADSFKQKLESRGLRTYLHRSTPGYPTDVDTIVSDTGFGANPCIETTKPLVIVTAPGPCSGKLATCLSQLYHEYKNGVHAGYAKFETFPIWSIPLKHPVNLAYEAATADLKDVNMIDPFHLESYGKTAVNYNRDIEVFPIVRAILERITGRDDIYRSPTDMGVNMAGFAISDDEVVRDAAKQEIIRRYYKARCDVRQGTADEETASRIELILKQLSLSDKDRPAIAAAKEKNRELGVPVMAIQLDDGRIVTGRQSNLMTSAAAAVLNCIKVLAKLPDELHLISPNVIEPIISLKGGTLSMKHTMLSLNEILLALAVSAASSDVVAYAMSKLPLLKGCEAHCTHMAGQEDESALLKLRVNLTCGPHFPSKDLFYQ